jgi:hypothetical protein
MMKTTYETIDELKAAIDQGAVAVNSLTGFVCKGELFIRAGEPVDLFIGYYGSSKACRDMCALLGIADIEDV